MQNSLESGIKNGLELAYGYYTEYGRKMLEEEFGDILDSIAVGLAGSGSECFGYDDEISQDHDFEPGFCIFIPGEDIIDSSKEFALKRAYDRLPGEYMGFKKQKMDPVGGSRHGVIRMDDFFRARCGSPIGEPDVFQWLTIPEYLLGEAVNGRIFFDKSGRITKIRESLKQYPDDIRLKKIAGYLLLMAQSGQYNYGRIVKRGDTAAAQMAIHEFVNAVLHIGFLIDHRYMPYYKWSFRAFRELEMLGNIHESLEYLISSGNEAKDYNVKSGMIEDISALVIKILSSEGVTLTGATDLEKQAYSVNNRISDGMLRNLDIFAGV